MAWSYRKRINIIPGVHLNLSRNGITTSVGVRGASVTLGKNGTYLNTGIPGTGIYQRQKLSGVNINKPGTFNYTPQAINENEIDIVSSDIQEITSQDMQGIKEAILMAGNQRSELKSDLVNLRSKHKLYQLKLGFSYFLLYGLIIKNISTKIRKDIKNQKKAIFQLQLEIEKCHVNLDIDLDEEFQKTFSKLIDDFNNLCTSNKIWDVTSEQLQDRVVSRSSAGTLVKKKEIRFSLRKLEFIKCRYDAMVFENANGADLYFYPNFIVMYTNPSKFAIIGIEELEFYSSYVRFTETGSIPKDSKILHYTWAKVNKNGSPDKRFKGNYQIPVVKYGEFTLRTKTGLHEEYEFSNYEFSNAFGSKFIQYQQMIKNYSDTLIREGRIH